MSTGTFRHKKIRETPIYPLKSSSNRLEIVFLYDIPIITLSSLNQLPGGAAIVRSYIT
jgi:hypothetical protein